MLMKDESVSHMIQYCFPRSHFWIRTFFFLAFRTFCPDVGVFRIETTSQDPDTLTIPMDNIK